MTDESTFSANLGGDLVTTWQGYVPALEDENVALRERLRVLTEVARAVCDEWERVGECDEFDERVGALCGVLDDA